MSKRHDDESPVHDYLRRYRRSAEKAPPTTQYLPTTPVALTLDIVRTPEMQEYLAYIERGDPRPLAEALVEGRLGELERRRDMVNYICQFVGLQPRPLSRGKQIADVTRQLTALYQQAAAMIAAKNTLADALIDHETKTGKLKLEQATYAAKLAEQERIKAEEEKKTRDAQAQSTPPNPHASRRAEQLAQREHLRQLLEKSEHMARLRKSIRELDGADRAIASPFRRAATVLAHQLPHIPTGSLLRKKVLKAVDALRTGDSVTTVQEILGEDFAAIRQTLKDCGIRVD